MKFKDIGILIFSISLLIIPGCLEMEVVDQPASAAFGSVFSSEVGIIFIKDDIIDDDDDRAMLFAVNKPSGWTIDSITYDSPEYGTGYFNYLGNAVDEFGPDSLGGIDVGWEDSLEAFHPSADGMHWQMYVSDQDTTSTSTEADPDSFLVVVNYTADDIAGNYLLKYYTTHSNNGDEDDEGNIAMDSANTVIPVPSGEELVRFRLNDNSWLIEDVMFKGTMSGWSLFQAYDDGTNGDQLAGDHVWTAQYLTANGDHEWGAISTENPDGTICVACDGSDGYGTWLIEGGNPEFSLLDGEIAGQVDYAIPADMAVSEGSVMFTVHDGTETYLDIEWKGTPNGWDLVQMYDDGTNGDETADDHIWTVIIPDITAGDHNWGAIENDGTSFGEWLIDGDNPVFNLESDLLTLHGSTDYEIPAPAGEDVTKFVLFAVDMTEWLDEEGNLGIRAFNIANGDQVKVAGSFNSWGDCTECTMTRTPGTNLFSVGIVVTAQAEDEQNFAYLLDLSDASLAAIAERFGALDANGEPTIVDWIGWETSPRQEGNRGFMLGPDDPPDNTLELPIESFYDAFPGSVVPEGTSIEATFSIDMNNDGGSGFDAAADSVYIRTHDKWLNLTQGYSDGTDLNHYGAVNDGTGIFNFTVTLNGPAMWQVYYKWGFYDVSESAEFDEAGGGLGGIPRIRYLHQDADADCAWPSSYQFTMDTSFVATGDQIPEPWDSSAICIELLAIEDGENHSLPENFSVSDNYPNPFNPSTQVEISLPMDSDISFKVYSLTGVEIYSYTQNAVSMGKYKIKWNGKDSYGRSLPSGVYIYEFKAGDQFHQTKKMTLLK